MQRLFVELRDIEIFLTLAEELHFGRTAERLHVSQARVSQAISKQERRLGVALFDRTSRRVTLTPVGRRLREDLQQALEPDLTVGPTVLTGGRVLAVSADHPLAERGTASLEDLADNHVVDLGPDAPEYWVASMVPTRSPSGRRIPRGPIARTFHEILSLVATGQCVHPLGEIAARYNRPPGIVFLPIPDAPTLEWALTWRSTANSPAIRALAQTATDLGPISL
jgi:DNA-binding transcriptional LysR family regulator